MQLVTFSMKVGRANKTLIHIFLKHKYFFLRKKTFRTEFLFFDKFETLDPKIYFYWPPFFLFSSVFCRINNFAVKRFYSAQPLIMGNTVDVIELNLLEESKQSSVNESKKLDLLWGVIP